MGSLTIDIEVLHQSGVCNTNIQIRDFSSQRYHVNADLAGMDYSVQLPNG